MKKTISSLICTLCCCCTIALAQEPAVVPMGVSIEPETTVIPATAINFLKTKLKQAATRNGMGATEDVRQFYLTCSYTTIEKHIVQGAPAKHFYTNEMDFFVVDAFAQKIFTSTSIEVKGVGNSAEQATIASLRAFSPSSSAIASFIKESNKKILAYYDAQYKTIILKAQSLAKVYQYDEALFQLSMVPEACVGYKEIISVATEIYQKYIDDQANKALAKATAIWNAGQDAVAAEEAGFYLAQIMPEATCYPKATALGEEIKAKVGQDIEYYRKLDEVESEREHELDKSLIDAWKAVGTAYGNNQKSVYYKSIL